jgi:hypothetical protein
MGCAVRRAVLRDTNALVVKRKIKDYFFGESWLTKQERRVLQVTLALLLVGWAVKVYRAGHPADAPVAAIEQVTK